RTRTDGLRARSRAARRRARSAASPAPAGPPPPPARRAPPRPWPAPPPPPPRAPPPLARAGPRARPPGRPRPARSAPRGAPARRRGAGGTVARAERRGEHRDGPVGPLDARAAGRGGTQLLRVEPRQQRLGDRPAARVIGALGVAADRGAEPRHRAVRAGRAG